MLSDRKDHADNLIVPSLNKDKWVISDRYMDSTIAYQGGGRGLDVSFLRNLNLFATEKLVPDLTFYLDVTVEEGYRRVNKKIFDRIENAGKHFQSRVRTEYLKLVEKEPNRVILVDGNDSVEKIHSIIWNKISN